jgi:hypothetical protein
MHRGHAPAVPGCADEPDQALLAGFHGRVQGAARRQRPIPLVGVDQRMELQQVDPVGAHPLERVVDVASGALAVALAGLARKEEVIAMAVHPGADPQLGIAVSGCGVDVVDAALEQQIEHPVGGSLIDAGKRGAAEQHRGAHMPVRPKGRFSIAVCGSPL